MRCGERDNFVALATLAARICLKISVLYFWVVATELHELPCINYPARTALREPPGKIYLSGQKNKRLTLLVNLFISFECFDDFGYERVAYDVVFGEVYEGYAFNAFEDVHSFSKAGILSVWKVYL